MSIIAIVPSLVTVLLVINLFLIIIGLSLCCMGVCAEILCRASVRPTTGAPVSYVINIFVFVYNNNIFAYFIRPNG